MGMLQYLEEDREQLQAGLVQARTPEHAQDVVEKELDRLLFRYNDECKDDSLRDAALYMVQSAKMMVPVINSAGGTKIWGTEEDGNAEASRGKKVSVPAVVVIVAGALLICGSLVAEGIAGRGLIAVSVLLKSIAAALIGCVLVFVSGRLSAARAGSQGNTSNRKTRERSGSSAGKTEAGSGAGVRVIGSDTKRTEIIVDPDRIWTCLRGVILTVDRNLELIRQEAEYRDSRQGISAGNGIGKAEAELFSEILELAYGQRAESAENAGEKEKYAGHMSGKERHREQAFSEKAENTETAEEMISSVKYYLHRRNVDTVDYKDGKREWFELLPGSKSGTIRPALVMGGELIHKGLATAEMI